MPQSARSPAQFRLLMSVALVACIAQGAWLTTVSVFLVETHPSWPAPAIASAAVGLSYLLSVLLAQWVTLRYFRLSLLLVGIGLLILYRFTWFGSLLIIWGFGWLRPIVVVLIRGARPDGVSANKAFGLYSILINVGWVIGSLTTDRIRFALGWPSAYTAMASLVMVASLLSLWLVRPSAREAEEAKAKPSPSLASVCGFLVAVVCFYLVSAQFQSVLPILVERDARPIHLAADGIRMTAGILAATHGFFVILLTIYLSIRKTEVASLSYLAGGLFLMAISMLVLALVSYPVSSWWILLTIVFMSAGEACVGPSMLALGSELVGLRRNAYWMAATVGNGASALLGIGWTIWGRGTYFGTLVSFCVLVGILLLATFRGQKSR